MNTPTRSGFRIVSSALALSAALVVLLAVGAQATPAVSPGHKPSAVSKMTFKIADHQVKARTPVTGTVTLETRLGKHWLALGGASLSVTVDGTQVATLTTDASGNATISYSWAAVGGHVMRVAYAGDTSHKSAERSQGFEVDPA